MPLQNRVMPTGEIVADPARGTLMGNRGILHDDAHSLGAARWRHRSWVTCALRFKGRKRQLMSPGTYTELFFLDEAVALAAGHRPCGECRRDDYLKFRAAFETANGPVANVGDIDRALHAARVTRKRRQITHEADCVHLPDGAFIALKGECWLVSGDRLCQFTPAGYARSRPRPPGRVPVLTPAPTVAALKAGYRPKLHESAAA